MVKEDMIRDGESIVYTMLERQPMTFGDIINSFGTGSPFQKTHTMSIVLKRLREGGKIVLDDVDGFGYYRTVSGFVDNVGIKARKVGKGLWDSMKYKITHNKWSNEYETQQIIERTPPRSAAYFAYHTFKRAEKSETRPSGWKITPSEFEWGQKFVSASKSTVFGDAEIELGLYNARGREWYDDWTMKGRFKRASQEELRIPRNKHLRYLQKAVEDIVPKAYERTQTGEMAADAVLWRVQGDRQNARSIITGALMQSDSDEVKALYAMIGADRLNLNAKEDMNRLRQYLFYISHRIDEKIVQMNRPIYA